MPVNNLIKLRRGTDWTSNPILSQGEPGFDTTNNVLKIGDGITAWDALVPIGSGLDYLQSHPNISAANSSDNTGRTYIQDVILDPNGHVIGISTGTESVVNTDTTYTAGAGLDLSEANQFNIDNTVIQNGDNVSLLNNDAGYLTSFTETNDLSSSVTWVNVPDANITESSVVQHSGALRLTESQIVDLQTYLTSFTETNDLSSAVTWANVPDANITESSVVQHTGAFRIKESQVVDLKSYLTSESNDLSSVVTWANVPDINITESSVIQHSGALELTESQIVDLQTYLTEHPTIASAASSSDNSGRTYIQDVLLDSNGHVIGITTATETVTDTNTEYTAGTGIALQGTEFNVEPSLISGRTEVTSVDADYLLIWDATDSELKKVDAGEFLGGGDIVDDTTPQLGGDLDAQSNNINSVGTLTATSLVKSGGVSSEFLKADGSVDTNTYLTSFTETDTLANVSSRGNTTTTTCVIPFLYANQAAFPNASTYHGAIAHSHSDGAMYFAHGGAWIKLANDSDILNEEKVEDFVGSMVTGNTQNGITVTYDDTNGIINFTVTSQTDENFTSADHTKLDGIEESADVTDTGNVTLAGALMDSEVTNLSQVKTFDSSAYATAAQGTKADSAQQPPSEGAFANGDKTKLDGIETSADVTDTDNVVSALSPGAGVSISAGGVISVSSLALTTVQTASDETAHLALTAQEGDVVVRSDENKSYVHNGGSAGTMSDYTLLLTPTDAVLSVAGNTGAVTAAQIKTAYEGESDTNAFTDAEQSKLDGIESLADITDIANVTLAGALMDSEVTNLSQVKTFDSSDYATAAQGTKADSAQQPPSEGAFANGDKTKLDAIEALADVTDATNVDAAGAVMNTDSSTASMSFVVDEDDMTSDSDTKVPTQQSVKAYVDANAGGDTLTEEQVEDFVGGMVTGNTETGITVTYQDSDGTLDFVVASQTDENFTTADHSKLDAIEASADVTDATNVDAAGAVMNTDTSTASMSFVVDEDNMASDSATKVPTQQSVKHYIDNAGYLTAHPNITNAANSSDNSGNSFIQDITLDSNGHVTDLTVATASAGGDGGIGSVVEDTTPQLGGNLDLNSKDINGTGDIDVTGSGHFSAKVEADSFVKDGGTSSQFLKADGSVDTSTYLTGSSSINSLSDVATSSPINNNQVLAYSAGSFTNTALNLALIAKGSIPFGGYSTSQMGHYFFFDGSSEAVINTDGADINFRVEGDTNTHLLFTDAGTERVGIGTATPASTLDVNGTLTATTLIKSGGTSSQFLKADGSVDTSTYSTTDTQLTEEQVEDFVGAMLTGNTETGITVTYEDGDGTIDFVVASQTDENFTTADHSKLDGIEASADVTDTTNVTAAGALMDSELTDLAGVKGVTISTLQVKPSEGAFANGDKTKLDAIEASADVTDATNVNAAGAVMNSDSTTAGMSFVVDEDNMSSDSDTKVPTQQSVKAYVDANSGGATLTEEQVEDFVGGMLTGNTETGITVTYDDSDGTIDFVVASQTDENFTTADHSKLDGIEASADVTDTANVTSAGALMDSELASIADVKALDQSVIAGASPNFVTTNMTDASDKRFMTDAQETKLDSVESNADVTDTANVTAAGALMDSELTDLAGVKGVTISTLQVKPSEGAFVNGDKTKLDAIEALADVTDATNVDAAGAVMNSDSSTASMSFVVDEDNMASDSATKVPTQQSVKAYVDANAGGGGGGGGSVTTVKGNGSQVGGADIVTLDFSSEFDLTESPDTEINIALSTEILSSGDLSTTLSGSTGIHLAYDSSADAIGLNVSPALISARTEVTSADADYLLVWDATDSELKKVDAGEFRGGGGGSSLTEEQVEDFVGGMVTGNTETFITVTYEDGDGTLDFVVPVKDEDNMASDSATHLATQQSIKAYVDANAGGGGGSTSVAAISADATISSDVNLVTTANTDRTVTLPSVSSGKIVRIKKVDAGTGTVIIARGGSSTIDGATQVALYSQFESMTIICDGTNWHVF